VRLLRSLVVGFAVLASDRAAWAQTSTASGGAAAGGSAVFQRACATCHVSATGIPGTTATITAPALDVLRQLTPDAIVTSLTSGRMRVQGEALSPDERRAVAVFLTGRSAGERHAGSTTRCAVTRPLAADALSGPSWNGWGAGLAATRYQGRHAGLTAADVPRLTLKWAFGFPGALAARTQPAVVGGRVFTGSESGDVFALDVRTGCTHWVYRARAAVRTAMTVTSYRIPYRGANRGPSAAVRYALYFGDGRANAYAIDADTGRELWVRQVDDHANAAITGAPTVHDGRVYVPVAAAGEEVRGGRLDYGCCTFRGSVSALDAGTGSVVWKSYSIPDAPKPRGVNASGIQLFGPAGAGIWGAPTIDQKRGVLYVGTGNGYADPPQPTSDAIIAFDLRNGRVRWVRQTVPNDVWIWQCPPTSRPPTSPDNPNCPARQGPDFDFATSPLIATTPGGRDLLVVPQKSGVVYALDPDRDGAIVWEYRMGDGSALGGQWGAAADGRNVYVGFGGTLSSAPGGMHAIDLATGRRVWHVPPQTLLCRGGADARCYAAQGGAVTAMPGVVFSGGSDGGLRAYSARDGSIVWQVDTNRDYDTVNGVKASGATIDGAGPVVVDGLLLVNSGYNGIVGRAGNVLLVFGVE
jgi:polyvinyl alcohol dehydrogenase (cytochrome)